MGGNHSCCACSSSVDPLRPREPPPSAPAHVKSDARGATQLSHPTTATSSLDPEPTPLQTTATAVAVELPDAAAREEAFRHSMDQLCAAVPAGSTDVFDVLFTQFAAAHRLTPPEIAQYLRRCLCVERRWYRYRDILPASGASPPTSPLSSPSSKAALSQMVATDMTVVQMAGVFGASAFVEHLLAVLVYVAAMATGAAAADAAATWPAVAAQVEAALAATDPVFGMTVAHMALLAQQGAALVRLLRRLLRWDVAGPDALAAVVDTPPVAWRALFDHAPPAPPSPQRVATADAVTATASRSLLLSVCAAATTAGKTLLHLVVEQRDAATLQAIARALIDLLQSATATATHVAAVLALWTRAEGRHGHTPLHVAAATANWAALEVALDHFVELLRLSVLRQLDALALPAPPGRSALVTMADVAAVLRAPDDDGDDVRALLQRQLAAVRHEQREDGDRPDDGHSDSDSDSDSDEAALAAAALLLRADDAQMRRGAVERCLALLDAFDAAAAMPPHGTSDDAVEPPVVDVAWSDTLLRVDVVDFPTAAPGAADGRCSPAAASLRTSLRASPVGWMCQHLASAFSSPARSTATSERMLSTHSSTGSACAAAADDDVGPVGPPLRQAAATATATATDAADAHRADI